MLGQDVRGYSNPGRDSIHTLPGHWADGIRHRMMSDYEVTLVNDNSEYEG